MTNQNSATQHATDLVHHLYEASRAEGVDFVALIACASLLAKRSGAPGVAAFSVAMEHGDLEDAAYLEVFSSTERAAFRELANLCERWPATCANLLSVLARELAEGAEVKAVFRVATTLDSLSRKRDFQHLTPEPVVDLMCEITELEGVDSAADLCMGSGGILAALHGRAPTMKLAGQEINRRTWAISVARLALDDVETSELYNEDSLISLPVKQPGEFDLVISALPLGLRDSRESLKSERKWPLGYSSSAEWLLLQQALAVLAPGGRWTFLVPVGLVDGSRKQNLGNVLFQSAGLDRYVELPAGILGHTGIPVALISGARDAIPDMGVTVVDAARLYRRNPSGYSVEPEEVQSLKAMAGGKSAFGVSATASPSNGEPLDIRSEMRAVQLEPVIRREYGRLAPSVTTLGEVSICIAQETSRGRSAAEPDPPNSIWVSVGGKVRTSKLTKEAIRVELDPSRFDARFLAGFFGTEVGRQVLTAHLSGVIPRIPRSALPEIPIPDLDLEGQQRVVAIGQKIARLREYTGELEEQLHSSYRDLDNVGFRVDEVTQFDTLEAWTEQLPYPLASVLWLALGETESPGRQFKHLLHFFEAAVQFHAVVLLSALGRGEFSRDSLMDKSRNSPGTRKNADFGTWIQLGSGLAKISRSMAGEAERRDEYFDLLGSRDQTVHELLTDTSIYAIFVEAGRVRNERDGHGHYIDDAQFSAYVAELLGLVEAFREKVGTTWSWYSLVRPGRGELRADGYHQVLERLMGARETFQKEPDVRLPEPLVSGRLYMLDRRQLSSNMLLPLITLGREPNPNRESTAYFFNKLEGNTARFVAYQRAEQPELPRELDPELEFALGCIWPGK